MFAAQVGMRGDGAGATVRPLLYRKGRSPRTGKQHGGKENGKTAHERDRGAPGAFSGYRTGYQWGSIELGSARCMLDFHRKKAFIGVKSRQSNKYLIGEAL